MNTEYDTDLSDRIKPVNVHPAGGGEWFYTHEGTRYEKIVAGLALPGVLPGCCCVMGRKLYPVNTSGNSEYEIDVLYEFEERYAGPLLDRMSNAIAQYGVDCVYSYLDEAHQHYISKYNAKARRRGVAVIYLESPPYAENENLAVFIRIIQDKLIPERKLLHIGSAQALKNALMALQPEQISDVKASQFPSLAACGWGLAGLSYYAPNHHKNLPTTMDSDWESELF